MGRRVIEEWVCDGSAHDASSESVERGGWPFGWFVDADGRTVCPTCMARVLTPAPALAVADPQEEDIVGDLRKIEAWDTGR